MRVLELFSGSGIMSNKFRETGHETVKIDVIYGNDIFDFDYNKFRIGYFDVIWASPPCTAFSMGSMSHHINKEADVFYPKSSLGKEGIRMVLRTWEIIMLLQPKYWFIENPKATLHKFPFMNDAYKKELWYCRYGEKRAKPTNIWTNADIGFRKCYNNNPLCDHDRAPRGSKKGTQGLKDSFQRAKLPEQLCKEIVEYCENEQ